VSHPEGFRDFYAGCCDHQPWTRVRRQAIADSLTRGEGHAAYASDGDRAVTSALLDMAIDRPFHTTGKDG
jgi:hypothetical protein